MLPNPEDAPSSSTQLGADSLVSLTIGGDFPRPEHPIVLR